MLNRVFCVVLCLGIVSGCQSVGPPAPVESREPFAPAPEGFYRIHPGDTLGSIARRQGIALDRLARWNHLEPPYVIQTGALLRIRAPEGTRGKGKAPGVGKSKPKSTRSSEKSKVPQEKRVRRTPPKTQRNQEKRKPSNAVTRTRKLRWHWPLRGRIVQTFRRQDRTRRGIRIAAPRGAKIRAAEGGKVVYSGSGLKGYGNLIILKHSAHYLSVYGFNRRSLVTERETVRRGQIIAEIGRGPNGRPLLHFEIRRNGTAVNPLAYLPTSR